MRRSSKYLLVIVLVSLSFVLSCFLLAYFDFHRKRNIDRVTFEIKRGEGLISISKKIEDLGIVSDHIVFYLFARKHYKNFRAGEYELGGVISASDVVDVLQRGPTVRRAITVVPCWTIYHVADALAEKGIIEDKKDFIDQAHNMDFLKTIGIEYKSAEGFLYPDTYYFFKDTNPKDILAKMVENFFLKVGSHRIKMADRKLGFYNVLILASIIEAEARFEFEKRIIASVYLNRMRIGMPLQADPTVMYGFKIFTRPPTPADLKIDNEYNTYTRKGLPPTPICNPLVSSIDAVLKPERTNFLYFVARYDGTHFFSATYEEHIENIKKAKAERAKLKENTGGELISDEDEELRSDIDGEFASGVSE